MPDESIERVAVAIGSLADETRLLADEIRVESDGRKRQNRLLLALLALLLVGVVGIVTQLVRQQADTAERSQFATEQRTAQLELAEQINDCLKPTGQCYMRSQARQAASTEQLVKAIISGQRCTVSAKGDVAAYEACIKAAGLPSGR